MNNKQIGDLILEGFGNLYPLTYTTFTDYRDKMYDDEMFASFDWSAFESIEYSQGDLVFVETVDQ